MSGSVLCDQPGPRALRRERISWIVAAVMLVAGAVLLLSGIIDRGLFDDRWQIFTGSAQGLEPSLPRLAIMVQLRDGIA